MGSESEAHKLARLVLEWWETEQYEEVGGGDGDIPYNKYNEEPEFVKQARIVLEASREG